MIDVEFHAIGLFFKARMVYDPGEPAILTGPAENWHPGENDSLHIETLQAYDEHGKFFTDAMFLVEASPSVWDKIKDAAEAAYMESK